MLWNIARLDDSLLVWSRLLLSIHVEKVSHNRLVIVNLDCASTKDRHRDHLSEQTVLLTRRIMIKLFGRLIKQDARLIR